MAWKPWTDICHPYQSLLVIFTLWKGLLFLIVILTPGAGYDTSTTLIQWNGNATKTPMPVFLETVSLKLTRWDAIYFTKAANRGYDFEQEWAFSYGLSRLIHVLGDGLRKVGILDYAFNESVVGILVSYAAHGLSVIVLYQLIYALFPGAHGRKIALLAACLHVLSPAGAFLSAPTAESAHVFLSFCGSLFFVQSFSPSDASSFSSGLLQDALLVPAGILHGLATTCRSNGLLNGILFFEEAVRLLFSLSLGVSHAKLRRLLAVGVAGICTGLGFILPQYIAYQKFCTLPANQEPRVWCRRTIPSIYSFVQDHYWDNGFLRYWTLSNIPLFGLAAPMLAILMASGSQALRGDFRKVAGEMRDSPQARLTDRLLRSLAVPQVVLAVLTFFNHHVQVITRMSSGYPVWYLWLACLLLQARSSKEDGGRNRKANLTVNYMVVYALVQGVLFASFLPPA
ncbi:DUF409 domain protein [Aspergillus homomorphus CBS 101889]|uniref:GPI mannosyltransferase 2 n=1 Tax=Aspergillus homomorphus (strain CBS 101889) TaxID=1450537 RepID=A0A395IAC2_ASPHC|nr:mannosyltransferase [Aspergillus homomorphus CBS 101889]RAL17107.1 mannosyltransferase [Aspergillus homomorphus CBS 101889]